MLHSQKHQQQKETYRNIIVKEIKRAKIEKRSRKSSGCKVVNE